MNLGGDFPGVYENMHQEMNSFNKFQKSFLSKSRDDEEAIIIDDIQFPLANKLGSDVLSDRIEEGASPTQTFSPPNLGFRSKITLSMPSETNNSNPDYNNPTTNRVNLAKLEQSPGENNLSPLSRASSFLKRPRRPRNSRTLELGPKGTVLFDASPKGVLSEIMDFRRNGKRQAANNLLEEHLKKRNSTVIPFVKKFMSKLKNASSFRNITQLKSMNFKLLNDKSYFYDEVLKEQDLYESEGLRKTFLRLRACFEMQIYRIQKMLCVKYIKALLAEYRTVFHPYQTIKILWDICHLILIVFWFFYIPLLMAFEQVHNQQYSLPYRLSTYSAFFLICDVLINLNTSYFKNGVEERRRIKILNYYFKKRFFSDLVTCLPIVLDWIFYIYVEKPDFNTSRILHFFKFLFFIKFKTFREISNRILEKFQLKEKFQNILALFKVFFISLLVAHLFACFWYLTADISSTKSQTWLYKADLENSTWNTQYLYSMYWASVTMMTVGYGDITPQNSNETIVCLISVLLGCAVYAYNINSIGMILQDLNKESISFNHNINIINQFMQRKHINNDLQMRIREYLRFMWKEENAQNLEEEQKIIDLLSSSLKEELLIEAYGSVLKKYPMFFANFSENSLRKVVTIIKDIKMIPDETIFMEKGQDDPSIYFIMKGKVELFAQSGETPLVVKELGIGDYFGEVAFFSGRSRFLSARSKDFTTLFSINREEFIRVLQNNSDDFEKFCMIQDQILYYDNYFPLKLRCFSCNQLGHLSGQCHLIHFMADREKVIKTFNFYVDQERETKYMRKQVKRSALKSKKLLFLTSKKVRELRQKEREELNSKGWASSDLSEYDEDDYDEDDYDDDENEIADEESENENNSSSKDNKEESLPDSSCYKFEKGEKKKEKQKRTSSSMKNLDQVEENSVRSHKKPNTHQPVLSSTNISSSRIPLNQTEKLEKNDSAGQILNIPAQNFQKRHSASAAMMTPKRKEDKLLFNPFDSEFRIPKPNGESKFSSLGKQRKPTMESSTITNLSKNKTGPSSKTNLEQQIPNSTNYPTMPVVSNETIRKAPIGHDETSKAGHKSILKAPEKGGSFLNHKSSLFIPKINNIQNNPSTRASVYSANYSNPIANSITTLPIMSSNPMSIVPGTSFIVNHDLKASQPINSGIYDPSAELIKVLDNFERVKNFKNYFPHNNCKVVSEALNAKKISQSRYSRSPTMMRRKSMEARLAKYTFFLEEMKEKMPAVIKKKAAMVKKKREGFMGRLPTLKDEQGYLFDEEVLKKKQSQWQTKQYFSAMMQEQKKLNFSDVVTLILRDPFLKKQIKKKDIPLNSLHSHEKNEETLDEDIKNSTLLKRLLRHRFDDSEDRPESWDGFFHNDRTAIDQNPEYLFDNPNTFNFSLHIRKKSLNENTPSTKNRPLIYAFNRNLILKKNHLNETNLNDLPILSADLIFLDEPFSSIENIKLQRAFDRGKGSYAIIKYFDKKRYFQNIRLEDHLSQQINEFTATNYSECFVRSFGVFKEQDPEIADIFLIYEGSYMSLEDLLKLGKVFEVEELFPILITFIRALSTLQYNGIALRSICPRALSVFEQENRKVYKFSEFGLLACLPKGQITLETSNILGCIPNYASPELFECCEKNGSQDIDLYNPFVADVYSLGLMAVRMLGFSQAKTLVQQGLLEDLDFQNRYEKIFPILKQMLEKDPKRRLDFNQLESHISVNFGKNIDIFLNPQSDKKKERKYYQIFREKKAEKSRQNSKDLLSHYHYHRELYEAFISFKSYIKEAKFHLKKAFLVYEEFKEILEKKKKNSSFHDHEDTTMSPIRNSNLGCFGFDPREEIFCLSRMGEIYLKLGDYKKSEHFLIKSLNMCEKHFGFQNDEGFESDRSPLSPPSPKASLMNSNGCECFAWSYSRLGLLFKEEGNLEKSEKSFLRAFRFLKRAYGDSHEEIIEIKSNLGDLHFSVGNTRKAEEFYYKAVEITESLFGEKHEKSAEAYDRLASLYDNIGNLYKHQELQRKNTGKDEMTGSTTSLPAENLSLSRNIRNLARAEELYQKALNIRLELSSSDEKTAESYNNLGLLYDYLGNFTKAEENLSKALEIRLKIFGESHPCTATTYNNLGLLYFNMGNLQKAEDFYNRALAIRIEKFGEKHSETATSYNNLGLLYEMMHNYKLSKENLSRALRIFRNLYGENHGGTATSYNNLGLLYESIQNVNKAEDYYLKALKIRETLFGKSHGDTATSYNNLGAFYYSKGQYEKAEDYYMRALKIFEGFYGKNRGDTATSYNNLAGLYEKMLDFEKAESFYTQALEIRERVFGTQNKDFVNSLVNLGVFYENRGELQKAEDFYRRGLEINKALYGENHFETANGHQYLAGVFKAMKNYPEAEKSYLKISEIYSSFKGEKTAEIAENYEELGLLYEEMGEFDKAENMHLKCLEKRLELNGENDNDSAKTLDNIARVLEFQHNSLKAEEFYERALRVRENLFGPTHENTAISYYNLAALCDSMEEYERSLEFYNKSIGIYMINSQTNSGKLADCYNQLGVLYSHMQEFEKAEEIFTKSLEIREKHFGEGKEGIIEVHQNFGNLYKIMGKFEDALKHFNIILDSQRELSCENQNTVEFADSHTNIGSVHQLMGDFSKAEENYLTALHIKETIEGEPPGLGVADCLDNLGALYQAFGHLAKAEDFYLKSMQIKEKMQDESVRDSNRLLVGLYDKMGNKLKVQEFLEKEEARDSVYLETGQEVSNNSYGDIKLLCENMASVFAIDDVKEQHHEKNPRMSVVEQPHQIPFIKRHSSKS